MSMNLWKIEQLCKENFALGAASRDAEVVSLTNQRDYEYVRAENAEQERDQIRAEINVLRDALLSAKSMIGHPDNVAILDKALSTPTDTSALRELLKAERERVAKVVRDASFKIQSGSPHRKIFDAVVAEIRAMEDQ